MKKEINLLEEQLMLPHFPKEPQSPKSIRSEKTQIKKIIEALLFATNEPISFDKLREIIEIKIPIKPKLLQDSIEDLKEDYFEQSRAFQLEETSAGYVLKTKEEFSPYVEQLFRNKRAEKLSQAAIEVVAIIAYRQPMTKPQIDAIRGVDSSGILQNLLDRELIEPAGKLDAPGRPTLYKTTYRFLSHFGLKELSELPQIS